MLSLDLPKLPCLLYYILLIILYYGSYIRKLCVEFECDILNMI